MTTACLQRYAIFLQGYDFDICFRNTSLHANADALSRLPRKTKEEGEIDEDASSSVRKLELLLTTASQLKEATGNDLTLSKVLLFSKQGWPKNRTIEKDGNLVPFWHRRMELAVEQGCLLWGGRTVIHTKLRKQV